MRTFKVTLTDEQCETLVRDQIDYLVEDAGNKREDIQDMDVPETLAFAVYNLTGLISVSCLNLDFIELTIRKRPITITGSMNYDKNSDVYWHGIMGWVPKYVKLLEEDPIGTIGVNNGELYRYIRHTGKLGEEVFVYFMKLTKEETDLIHLIGNKENV